MPMMPLPWSHRSSAYLFAGYSVLASVMSLVRTAGSPVLTSPQSASTVVLPWLT